MMSQRKIAIIGANGMLAQAVRAAAPEFCQIHCFDLPDFDMTNRELVLSVLTELSPEIIINCAAFTDVDGCETQEDLASQVNGDAVGYLADASVVIDATLVHISTDYVFPGTGNMPLREDEPVAPNSAYGRSKLLGEQAILSSGLEKYFIIRTSWLYGMGGNNFVETIVRLAKERKKLGIVSDQIGSPTYTTDLAAAIFCLLGFPGHTSLVTDYPSPITAPYGIYHFSNEGICSWYDFAVAIVDIVRKHGENLKIEQISPIKTEDYPLPAKRPAYSVFSKQKYQDTTGMRIPFWWESLEQYFNVRFKN
jgi:dTDP-4-dehydrorhamnose reductase